MEEKEFATSTEVTAKLRRYLAPNFEEMLKDKLIRDAKYQGYRVVSEPKVIWQEQAFKRIEGEDGYFTLSKCDADDEYAFFNVGVIAMVVVNA